MERGLLEAISKEVIKMYKDSYPLLKEKEKFIITELTKEEDKFLITLDRGLKEFDKLTKDKKELSGAEAFLLYQSYGFPIEITQELALEKKIKVDVKWFDCEYKKHRDSSSTTAAEAFKGGLSDNSTQSTRLHTATHMLAEALRRVLKSDIHQKGSNITTERLRFDFNFQRKLTAEELKKVEDLVNEEIAKGLTITKKEMILSEAKKLGAQGEFEQKYGEKVFVYLIGDFSKEVCGGPHAQNTKELGHFKIQKEESVAAGVRRIKGVLE
jgi:alanyl-tRNA synthetase